MKPEPIATAERIERVLDALPYGGTVTVESKASDNLRSVCLAGPAWHDRPTGPGLWLCMPDPSMATMKGSRPLGMFLTDDDIARGCPFYTPRVYGPIPEDKRDGE